MAAVVCGVWCALDGSLARALVHPSSVHAAMSSSRDARLIARRREGRRAVSSRQSLLLCLCCPRELYARRPPAERERATLTVGGRPRDRDRSPRLSHLGHFVHGG